VVGEDRFRGSPAECRNLKRDVVGSFSRLRVDTVPEQAELPRYDFSTVALAAPVLRLVLAGSQPTLDIDLPAFAQEPLARIREPSERNRYFADLDRESLRRWTVCWSELDSNRQWQ
jgi:hypothetical protein